MAKLKKDQLFAREHMADAVDSLSEALDLLYALKTDDVKKIIKIRRNIVRAMMIIHRDEMMLISLNQGLMNQDDEDDNLGGFISTPKGKNYMN
jgi:hypothetical protein